MHLSGTLSNKEVLHCHEVGLIYIDPFNPDNLGTNSYDVTLGEWFYREQHPLMTAPIFNPYDEHAVTRVWGQPQRAEPYYQLVRRGGLPPAMESFEGDDLVFLLAPGETILAHTIEFIGGRVVDLADTGLDAGLVEAFPRPGITTKMHARSSLGRSMVGVCKCAGLGDAGYINRWTMEITSFAQYHWIPLVVGRRIAQIEFMFLNDVDGQCTDRSTKYQSEAKHAFAMQKAWKPDMMLPRLYQDHDVPESS